MPALTFTPPFRSSPFAAAALVAVALFIALLTPTRTLAGQPLICHPYEIGEARSLPVDHRGGIASTYDRRQLVDDTLALLTPDTPVLVRMETLRRAALYATADLRGWGKGTRYTAEDIQLATALLEKLRERSQHASDRDRALAWFDLGFYSETLRQANVDPALDGYALLVKAAEARPAEPAIEFALALASSLPQRPQQITHLARARAATVNDHHPLLAANLASHFRKS